MIKTKEPLFLPITLDTTKVWNFLAFALFVVEPIFLVGVALYLKQEASFEHYWTLLLMAVIVPIGGIAILKTTKFGRVMVDRLMVTSKPARFLGFTSSLADQETPVADFSHLEIRKISTKNGTNYYIDLVHSQNKKLNVQVASSSNHEAARNTAAEIGTLIGKPLKEQP